MRLHPLTALTRGLRRGFVAAFGALFLSGAAGSALPSWLREVTPLLAPLVFVAAAGYQVAYYYRFEYDLSADTFDVASGVVGRTEREIPYRRVQNVDLTESVVHRLLGVAVVRIETAGGSATEATLNFVGADEARRLQREIRERRAAVTGERGPSEGEGEREADATPAEVAGTETEPLADGEAVPDATVGAGGPVDPAAGDTDRADGTAAGARADRDAGGPDRIFRLGESELLVLSLTSFRRAAVILLAVLFPLARETVLGTFTRLTGISVDVRALLASPDLLFLTGLAALSVGFVAAWALSAALTFAEYYGFTLGRQGEDLVYDRGLLQRYSGSIPTEKVQTLTVTETLPMRALGYAGLTVETAGYSPGQGGQDGSQAAVPLAGRDRTFALAREVEPFGEFSITRAPKVARRRYAVRYLLVVLAMTGAFAALARVVSGFTLWYTPLALLVLVPVAAHYKWKHRGYYAGEEYFVARTGFWRRRTRVVPYYRLQTVIRARTVFQRRLGLAHLTADTATTAGAGGTATVYDIDAGDARRLFGLARERLQESVGARAVE